MHSLQQAGAEEVPAEEGVRELPLPGRRSEDLRYMRLPLDEVLADWLAALDRQVGGRGGRRGPRPAMARGKRKRR